MLFNAETDYAIRIVHCLANCGKRMEATAISKETGVTFRFSLKILRRLVVAGIVKSFKGVGGGYELARPAAEITLGEVIEEMCGPLVFGKCQTEGLGCTHPMGTCIFKKVFDETSDFMKQKFDNTTFDHHK